MKSDEKCLTFVSRVEQLACVLKSKGIEIDDAEVAGAMLSGLLEKFDFIITALDALGKESLAVGLVESNLLQMEQRNMLRKSSDSLQSVLFYTSF